MKTGKFESYSLTIKGDINIPCLVRPEIQILLQVDLFGGGKKHILALYLRKIKEEL